MAILSAESLRAARYVTARAQRLRILRWVVYQLEAILVLYLGLFAAFMTAVFFELKFHPWTVFFWLFNLLLAGLLAILLVKIVIPMSFRKTSIVQVSAEVERQIPGLKQRLITAVELSRADEKTLGLFARGLLELFYQDAFESVRRSVAYWRVIRRELLILLLLATGTITFLSTLPTTTFPMTARDLAATYINSLLRPPFDVAANLNVIPGDLIILTGSDVEIRAQLLGKEGESVLRFHSEGFPWEEEYMIRSGESEFHYSFKALQTPLAYQVIAGGIKSRVYQINIASPPQLQSLRLRIHPPDYSRLPAEKLPENEGNLDVLIGTKVDVNCLYNKTMKEAFLDVRFEGDAVADSTRVAMLKVGNDWAGSFVVSSTGAYTISARDEQGFDAQPVNFNIRIKPDALPSIKFTAPEEDSLRAVNESVTLSYEATDDIGIARIYLACRIPGSSTRTRILAREEVLGNTVVRADYVWDTSELPHDDNIKFRLEAFDWAYLSRHASSAFDPEKDTRFAATEEKYLIRDPNRVYAEDTSSSRPGDQKTKSAGTIQSSTGSADNGQGVGIGDGNAASPGGIGNSETPPSGQEQILDVLAALKQLAKDQKQLTQDIIKQQNSPSPQNPSQKQELANRQQNLSNRSEELSKLLQELSSKTADSGQSPVNTGQGKETPEGSKKPAIELDTEALKKLSHDFSKKDLYKDDRGLTQRKGLGKIQEEVRKELASGRLENASKKSMEAEEKMEELAKNLEKAARNEPLDESKEKEELAKADEKKDEEKKDDEETKEDKKKKEEEKTEEPIKSGNQRGGIGSSTRTGSSGIGGVGSEGIPKGEIIPPHLAGGDLDPTLSETADIRIIDSRTKKEDRNSRALQEEKYPPKYVGVVEEYLRSASKN